MDLPRSNKGAQDSEDNDLDIQSPRITYSAVATVLNKYDLPTRTLERFMPYLDIRDQIALRASSKKFRDLHTNYIIGYHHKCLARLKIRGDTNAAIQMNVWKEATEFFVNAGFREEYANSLLKIYSEDKRYHLSSCIFNFMKQLSLPEVPNSTAPDDFKTVCYLVTLLNILRQFKEFRQISSEVSNLHWVVKIELPVIYLDPAACMLGARKKAQIMAVIARELLNDKCKWEVNNKKESYRKKPQRLSMEFRVLAPNSVLDLLKNALAGNVNIDTVLDLDAKQNTEPILVWIFSTICKE